MGLNGDMSTNLSFNPIFDHTSANIPGQVRLPMPFPTILLLRYLLANEVPSKCLPGSTSARAAL